MCDLYKLTLERLAAEFERQEYHRMGNGTSRSVENRRNKHLGIFVVHGDNEAMRVTVARHIKMVILLSPDDIGDKSKSTSASYLTPEIARSSTPEIAGKIVCLSASNH